MDWFLFDIGLRHERVKPTRSLQNNHAKNQKPKIKNQLLT